MRLHPAASRIAKLAVSTPARLVVFDMLEDTGGQSLLDTPLSERRKKLVAFVEKGSSRTILELSPATSDRRQAARWLQRAGRGRYDGVVAKRLDGLYEPGERQMLKIKRLRTADCVVGGFRYRSGSDQVGSLLLGLYDRDGKLNHVGFTSTISNEERQALTRRLESLRRSPGFTGSAPGGPSRWSTERTSAWEPLRPKLVVEVRFDQVTDGRFRHGTKLVRWRPDKAPTQCGCDQIG
jgi:ATP-dependent DNA ligase